MINPLLVFVTDDNEMQMYPTSLQAAWSAKCMAAMWLLISPLRIPPQLVAPRRRIHTYLLCEQRSYISYHVESLCGEMSGPV